MNKTPQEYVAEIKANAERALRNPEVSDYSFKAFNKILLRLCKIAEDGFEDSKRLDYLETKRKDAQLQGGAEDGQDMIMWAFATTKGVTDTARATLDLMMKSEVKTKP